MGLGLRVCGIRVSGSWDYGLVVVGLSFGVCGIRVCGIRVLGLEGNHVIILCM